MKTTNFYNSVAYKERQSGIAKENWEKGIYDYLHKREKRQCANPECQKWFETKPSSTKRFCSRKCAAQVNNAKRSSVSPEAKEEIARLYQKGLSMKEISDKTSWSFHQVTYWLNQCKIPRRSISDAVYQRLNPEGDPFCIKKHLTPRNQKLFGLGIGLYWGEGNKRSKSAVRLGNSDPKLIKSFREFLIKICGIKQEKLKYNLLLFNDANKNKAINFWAEELGITKNQIGSITSLKPRGKGTYKKKSMTGVLIIEFNNTKLKKQIDKMVKMVSENKYARIAQTVRAHHW